MAALWLTSPPSIAQSASDGDTLRWHGERIRLYGIDAPELAQTCDNGAWPGGVLARDALAHFLEVGPLACSDRGQDRYGRTIATCTVGGNDLAALMVGSGWAWAFTRYGIEYVDAERRAAAKGLGVHGHRCTPAWEWRREH